MRTRRCVLLGAAALLGLALPASALYIKLDRPGVAFAQGYPKAAQQQVMDVLNRKDCTFVEGHGLNSHTTLDYRSNTVALNLFLENLAACPGVTLSVSLKKLPEGLDWRLSHDAHANRFHAQVNLNSKRLDLESLVIPELKGPAAAK